MSSENLHAVLDAVMWKGANEKGSYADFCWCVVSRFVKAHKFVERACSTVPVPHLRGEDEHACRAVSHRASASRAVARTDMMPEWPRPSVRGPVIRVLYGSGLMLSRPPPGLAGAESLTELLQTSIMSSEVSSSRHLD